MINFLSVDLFLQLCRDVKSVVLKQNPVSTNPQNKSTDRPSDFKPICENDGVCLINLCLSQRLYPAG